MMDLILILLNKVLLANESSQKLLTKNQGKSFRLVLPVFSISAIINANGLLDIHTEDEVSSTITIPTSIISPLKIKIN